MNGDSWLPLCFELGDAIQTQRLLHHGSGFQWWRLSGRQQYALVVDTSLRHFWQEQGYLTSDDWDAELHFTGHDYALLFDECFPLAPIGLQRPVDFNDALPFARALRQTRQQHPNVALAEALYLGKRTRLLPLPQQPPCADSLILGCYLSGKVLSCFDAAFPAHLAPPWTAAEVTALAAAAGLLESDPQPAPALIHSATESFELIGRPALTRFLREQVIAIVQHPERYRAFGIGFPTPILLQGPPGCGKTFAVERLAEFLGWPTVRIDSARIGSSFIHETARLIAAAFEDARAQAPALLIIDEMDAFLAQRDGSAGGALRVEEVAEFLRRIPEAPTQCILVIGMTNRLDMIDPAILRHGRFDHILSVEQPERADIAALLIHLLRERPCAGELDLEPLLDRLAGKPLATVAFVVREAGRCAASRGLPAIDNDCLREAVAQAQRPDESRRPIGFVHSP